MKRRRVIFAASFVVAIGALTFFLLRGASGPPEPVYQGKTLSQWLSIWDTTGQPTPDRDIKDCETAVRAIGPKAVPFLLNMLNTADSPWKQRAVELIRNQSVVKVHYVKPRDLRDRGLMGLIMLGPEGKSAVPELIRMYDSAINPEALYAKLLGNIGPCATSGIPKILITSTSARNEKDRAIAIEALGKIHADAASVLPVLITSLTNKSLMVLTATAIALGEYESKAKVAVPALIKLAERFPPTNYPSLLPYPDTFFWEEPGAAAIGALSRIDKAAYENFTRSK